MIGGSERDCLVLGVSQRGDVYEDTKMGNRARLRDDNPEVGNRSRSRCRNQDSITAVHFPDRPCSSNNIRFIIVARSPALSQASAGVKDFD